MIDSIIFSIVKTRPDIIFTTLIASHFVKKSRSLEYKGYENNFTIS